MAEEQAVQQEQTPQGPTQAQINESPSVICGCGSDVWRQGVVVKQVTDAGNNKSYHTVPVLTCIICNRPLVIKPEEAAPETQAAPQEQPVPVQPPAPTATSIPEAPQEKTVSQASKETAME